MSYGLVCLACRRYIAEGPHACVCADPQPSWNARTLADEGSLHDSERRTIERLRNTTKATPPEGA